MERLKIYWKMKGLELNVDKSKVMIFSEAVEDRNTRAFE